MSTTKKNPKTNWLVFGNMEYKGICFLFRGSECTNELWPAQEGENVRLKNTNSHNIRVGLLGCETYTTFKYWTSLHNGPVLKSEDLPRAFHCFVDDAIYGEYTFDEFVDELGYDNPKTAYRIWTECKKATKKLRQVYDGDLYDLINWLNEQESDGFPAFHSVKYGPAYKGPKDGLLPKTPKTPRSK